ncbi:MAG: hypothetical protein LBT31_03295 [Synergistaceae bacterium]|nr:hypothetical protein [Synergistaceae bacterium]
MFFSELKPELEIPEEVWNSLEVCDFVNFPVPLLNPPYETERGLEWSGHELMVLSENVAAFERDEDAAFYMPYGKMFKIMADTGEERFAQIYSVFFERQDGKWRMMYRLMNCDRVLRCEQVFPESSVSNDFEAPSQDALSSNWMLCLSGIENWLTLNAYLDYYCKFESYNRSYVAANVNKQLEYMEGRDAHGCEARVMPLPGGVVVLVSRLTKGIALVVDIVKNKRMACFVMDDPSHLVELFWQLHSKMFLSSRDMMAMEGMICDARHYLYAIKSAREQKLMPEELTAAAFYC